jgi:hypothetical protein
VRNYNAVSQGLNIEGADVSECVVRQQNPEQRAGIRAERGWIRCSVRGVNEGSGRFRKEHVLVRGLMHQGFEDLNLVVDGDENDTRQLPTTRTFRVRFPHNSTEGDDDPGHRSQPIIQTTNATFDSGESTENSADLQP